MIDTVSTVELLLAMYGVSMAITFYYMRKISKIAEAEHTEAMRWKRRYFNEKKKSKRTA